ncbi:hypothetical protein, partial [Burkholderia multivorans]
LGFRFARHTLSLGACYALNTKFLTGPTFDEAAEYLADLQQWKIPYRVDNRRYMAKMTCKGFVVDNVGPFD